MLGAGESMRDAIANDLARLPGWSVTVAVRQQETSHAERGPRVRMLAAQPGESALDFVRRQAPLHDRCWVVAPETDGLLLRLHEAVGERRWIGCSAAAIRVAGSKRATCEALDRVGIATPLAFTEGHRGGWIVKPDDGAGSMATRYLATRAEAEDELRQRMAAGASAVAEPFVPGEALSVSLLVGANLARALAFNRQHLQTDAAGWLHDLGVQAAALGPADPRTATLHALAGQVAAALPGLRGYVGIDIVWNERKGPVVIEVNPRVTCAYVGLSAILDRNLAADVLAVHPRAGEPEVASHAAA